MNNLAIFVDKNDKILGYHNRYKLKKGDIIRISLLWIENSKNEILLARRSPDKQYDPNKWGPAVGGTLEKGETYKINIEKEAMEEIGLAGIKFTPFLKTIYFRPDGTGRSCQFFKAVIDRPIEEFELQKEEVVEVRWFKKSDVLRDIKTNPEKFVGSSHLWTKFI